MLTLENETNFFFFNFQAKKHRQIFTHLSFNKRSNTSLDALSKFNPDGKFVFNPENICIYIYKGGGVEPGKQRNNQ